MEKDKGYSKKLLAFFIVFFVVIAFLAIYGSEHYNGHDETIELEQYCKVSDTDLMSNHNTYIYYVTWAGSPYGDAGSWAIYKFMESNGYNTTSFKKSTSMCNYEYNDTPGIVFNGEKYDVKYNNINTIIVPVYLYGENLTSNTTVTAGLQTLKEDLPAPIYKEIKIYTTEAIVDGLSIPSDNISAISHINSVTLITGPSGAYILNGYIIDPNDFIIKDKPLTPDAVLKDIKNNNNINAINSAMEGLESTIKDVQ